MREATRGTLVKPQASSPVGGPNPAIGKAGVEFLAEDNGGAGVRLKPKKTKGKRI